MKTIIKKDGDGYLAQVEGYQNLFAFAYSEKEAIIELKNVVEMMMDYHLKQVNDGVMGRYPFKAILFQSAQI